MHTAAHPFFSVALLRKLGFNSNTRDVSVLCRCKVMPRSGATLSVVGNLVYLFGGQVRSAVHNLHHQSQSRSLIVSYSHYAFNVDDASYVWWRLACNLVTIDNMH